MSLLLTLASSDSGPTIPAFTDFVLSAGLFNLNPVGYSGGSAFRVPAGFTNYPFLTTLPYLPNYSGVTNFEINRLYDQSASVNRFNTGTGNPSLILTSPTVVVGAGTAAANGTLTYFGLTNGRYSAVYEGSADPTVDGIYWNSGESRWYVMRAAVDLYRSSDDVPYPWQVTTWEVRNGDAPVPTVTQGTPQTAIISFDGVDDQLVTFGNVLSGGSQQGTVYVYFKDEQAGATTAQVFTTGSNPQNQIRIKSDNGGLLAQITSSTDAESRWQATIDDADWHFLAFGFDTTNPTPANQSVLYLDGVLATQSISGDIDGELMGDGLGYLGIDFDNDWKLNGSMLGVGVKNVRDTPAQMEAMRLWVENIPK